MPVRSLNSSVLTWPDRTAVDSALRRWAVREAGKHPELCRLGYFGSYARDEWGVGSDVDLVAVVGGTDEPFEKRPVSWDTHTLPVPAELLVYTEQEWFRLLESDSRFARTLTSETVWVFSVDPSIGS